MTNTMQRSQLFINGQWVPSKGTILPVVSPTTGVGFGEICQATEDEVDCAIKAARGVLGLWRDLGVKGRVELLRKVVDELRAESGQLGERTALKQLIMDEMGKRFPEADIEAVEAVDMFAFFVDSAETLLKTEEVSINKELWPTKKSYILYEPVGVIGLIKPWNYPLELPIWSIAAALAAGNTIVFKPSEHSTFTGLAIGKAFEKAGIPSGVFNIVTGDGSVGRLIVNHSGIDMIGFTGSVATGKEIAVACAKTLKRYSLELGGNDAAIVLADVDIEMAANGLVWGAFCNAGQVCVRTKRAYVDKKVNNELLQRLLDKTMALRPGIDFGPIVSEKQLQLVDDFVKDAVAKGASIACGGKKLENLKGYYYSPTILINVPHGANLLRQECFGPILPLIAVSNEAEAIEMANDSIYGLGASVWTKDLRRGEAIAAQLFAGMVWVNDVNVAFPEAPWGGQKQSGVGIELSKWGLYEYTHKKHISVELSEDVRRAWWYPYD